ncbi:MAG: TIGR01777 family protein [Desulfamplus sp.]|nr:TIGR01777 family protein [Desulfamplus sp.]
MADKIFIKQIDVNAPVETVFGWHEKPGAFERLTPPWMKLKNIHKSGKGIDAGTTLNMDICFANIPFSIKAEHIDYEKNRLFKDRLYGGIFSKWEHTHRFLPLGKLASDSEQSGICSMNNGISRLEDRIDYALPFHIPDKWHDLIRAEMYRLFNYRHNVMVNDLDRHRSSELQISSELRNGDNTPKSLTILISGASGPVGNALVPFLTTGGHRVIKLVRRTPKNGDEIYWNPYTRELNLEQAFKTELTASNNSKSADKDRLSSKIDVVINLNGYNIGAGKWTEKIKELIIKSRTLSTSLIAEKISSLPLNLRPELFISASATGFYGNSGDSCLDENSTSGELFISKVCREWEKCGQQVEECGIRTVFPRIGVVLTPAGGVLERLLPGFMMGLGAKIGSGEQYMSWISIDDLVYALNHIINDKSIHGVVNATSPNPVRNSDFTQILAKAMSRPAPFTLPASLIQMVWGEMGKELLLSSTRVLPKRLINSGFRFSHPTLEQAFRHLIGTTAE